MRLPRWLVVSLLSVSMVAVLSAGTWWWVTWPDRTARKFTTLMADGNWKETMRMTDREKIQYLVLADEFQIKWDDENLLSASRNVIDVLLARQSFRIPANEGQAFFTVERGRVIEPCEDVLFRGRKWPINNVIPVRAEEAGKP
jgi:hypothetical protein